MWRQHLLLLFYPFLSLLGSLSSDLSACLWSGCNYQACLTDFISPFMFPCCISSSLLILALCYYYPSFQLFEDTVILN